MLILQSWFSQRSLVSTKCLTLGGVYFWGRESDEKIVMELKRRREGNLQHKYLWYIMKCVSCSVALITVINCYMVWVRCRWNNIVLPKCHQFDIWHISPLLQNRSVACYSLFWYTVWQSTIYQYIAMYDIVCVLYHDIVIVLSS